MATGGRRGGLPRAGEAGPVTKAGDEDDELDRLLGLLKEPVATKDAAMAASPEKGFHDRSDSVGSSQKTGVLPVLVDSSERAFPTALVSDNLAFQDDLDMQDDEDDVEEDVEDMDDDPGDTQTEHLLQQLGEADEGPAAAAAQSPGRTTPQEQALESQAVVLASDDGPQFLEDEALEEDESVEAGETVAAPVPADQPTPAAPSTARAPTPRGSQPPARTLKPQAAPPAARTPTPPAAQPDARTPTPPAAQPTPPAGPHTGRPPPPALQTASNAGSPAAAHASSPKVMEASMSQIIQQLNEMIGGGNRKLYGKPIRDVQSFFAALDQDGSLALDRDKIAQGFHRLDVTVPPKDVSRFLETLDEDGNGRVELVELMRGLHAADHQGRLSPSLRQRREDAGEQPPTSPTASQLSRSPQSTTKARWRAHHHQKLSSAKALTKEVFKKLLLDGNQKPASEDADGVQLVNQCILRKVANTEDTAKSVEERISSVEDSIRQAGESMFQLQRYYQSLIAPLRVCELRLEMREARPESERVLDQCQVALEAERDLVATSQEELQAYHRHSEQMLRRLDAIQGELTFDLQSKRQLVRFDKGCISARKNMVAHSLADSRIPSRADSRLALPALKEGGSGATTPRYAGSGAITPKATTPRSGAATARPSTGQETPALLAKAVKAEEDSLMLVTRADAVMKRALKQCAAAASRSQSALQHRVQEISTAKKNLEAQKAVTIEAIGKTQQLIARIGKDMSTYMEPLRTLELQIAAPHDGSPDSRANLVNMMEQRDLLRSSVQSLEGKSASHEALLQRLMESKEDMELDLQGKTKAKAIDDQCMKVTLKKALAMNIGSIKTARS